MMKNVHDSSRIIGGHEAAPHSRPYMVYLLMMGKDTGKTNCGGFLIREDFVLTAAHCDAENITAILGAHNIMSPENSQQIIKVVKAIPFPSYCKRGPNDDIMLLKLEKKAALDEKVAILPLSKNEDVLKVGSTCSTAGWGLVESEGIHMVSKLQEVNMSVFRRLCAAKWGAMFTEYMTCASSPMEGGCNGDSGGPLVCDGVAHGVLSFSSEPCGYFPTVFMKISMYVDWITREMDRH
ncbi:mast cell protease 1A-like isoform X2 [Polyodon spathula]|uniref:mast cell protease 1A-like isoform X2 n=1 Tax=Polyodon spathula TaxID=7913 RepID=UPI001B7DA702|nr:mast cell protease 1A-like isoform X2 [Polyodon spathula]